MDLIPPGLTWSHVFVFLGAGALSGLLSGIFGIAGGTILVPLIFQILSAVYQMPSVTGIKVAIATSLACIALSSTSTLYFQRRSGLQYFAIVRPLLLPIAFGTSASVLVATAIPAGSLQYAFAIYLVLFFLVSFLYTPSAGRDAEMTLSGPEVTGVGFGMGILSGLLGIGGAFLSVPYLVKKGFSFRQAVGASPAIQCVVSVTGGIGFMYSRVDDCGTCHANGLIGSVHVPILVFLGLSAILMTKVGVKIATRIATGTLKLGFELFLLAVAVKLLFS